MELLEIERELAGEGKEAAMKKYDQVLVALGERLESALRAGLEPAEYARCSALKEANIVARKLLRLQVRDACPA